MPIPGNHPVFGNKRKEMLEALVAMGVPQDIIEIFFAFDADDHFLNNLLKGLPKADRSNAWVESHNPQEPNEFETPRYGEALTLGKNSLVRAKQLHNYFKNDYTRMMVYGIEVMLAAIRRADFEKAWNGHILARDGIILMAEEHVGDIGYNGGRLTVMFGIEDVPATFLPLNPEPEPDPKPSPSPEPDPAPVPKHSAEEVATAIEGFIELLQSAVAHLRA